MPVRLGLDVLLVLPTRFLSSLLTSQQNLGQIGYG